MPAACRVRSAEMSFDGEVHLDVPANADVLAWLRGRAPDAALGRPGTAGDRAHLATKEDLVDRLWDACTAELPTECTFVVHDHAALVRHDTGVVFALVIGNGLLALRLPPDSMAVESVGPRYGRSHVGMPAYDIGEGWMIVPLFAELAPVWCLRAYGHAAVDEPVAP